MNPILLVLVVLGIVTVCVAAMCVGVIAGRKPIQHCGGAALKIKGEAIDCPACAKSACPNNRKGACHREDPDPVHS